MTLYAMPVSPYSAKIRIVLGATLGWLEAG